MIKRKLFAACITNAGIIGIVCVLAAHTAPAFAQLTIDTERTEPVSTSEAPEDENLVVAETGSVTVDLEGPIVTIDSDTDVIIEIGATLTNSVGSNGVGIAIDLTDDRTGLIDFRGGLVLGEPDINVPIGSNITGIRIGTAGAVGGKYIGNLTFGDIATLVVVGDDSVGIAVNQEVVGNLTFDGGITISGIDAVGFMSTAAITGHLTFISNVVARGTATPTAAVRDQISGSAISIGASITKSIDHDDDEFTPEVLVGGVKVNGPLELIDFATRSAQIISLGGAPAVYISPFVAGGAAANIEFGLYSDFDGITNLDVLENDPNFDTSSAGASTFLGLYSFVNRGNIQGNGLEPGVDTEAFRIEGDGVNTVTFEGGFYNKGVINAQAVSHNLSAINDPEAPSDATALIIGNGVTIPTLVNEGTITGQTSGPEGGTGIGVLIEAGGFLPSITNTSTSAINGFSLTNADTDLNNIEAYAIIDLSRTLLTINNHGLITATATQTSGGSTAVAIDVSLATEAVTITNTQLEDSFSTATIIGDILMGSSLFNKLTIDGHVTNNEGVTSRASVSGRVLTTGEVDVTVTDGLLRTEEATVGGLTVGSAGAPNDEAGTVEFLLAKTPNIGPIITASGAVDFHTNATASFSSLAFLGTDGVYTLLSASGGINLNGRDLEELVAFDSPFLFRSEFDLTSDGGTDTISLSLERKTAADLNLTANSAAIFDAALIAASEDDFFGRGLLAITDEVGVEQALASLLPNIGVGARALSIAVTDSIGGPIGRRQRSLIATPEQGLRFWGQQFYQDLNGGSTATAPSFFGSGSGVSVGMEWGQTPTVRYGVSYTYFAGQVTETGAQTTKENIALNLASAYASWRSNSFFVTPQANIGYASYDNRRRVVAGPIARLAISDWNTFLASGGVTSGYVMDIGAFQVIPHISIDGLYMHDTAYTERFGGPGVSLALGTRTTRSVRVFAGVVAQTEFALDDGIMKPQILAGWSQDLVNDRPTIDASFEAVPGSDFSVVGPVSDASRLLGGASFSYLFNNWSAAFSYDASHTSGALAQSASISMTSRF